MKGKKSRIYSTGMMAALNHPMRITLFDLIREGTLVGKGKDEGLSTPEIAEILNENRINLYHHLAILETAGLIESFYFGDRMKKYRLVSNIPQQKLEVKINKQMELSPEEISRTQTLILTPPQKEEKKFRDKAKELIKLTGGTWNNDMDILQVQINWQPKNVVKYKHKQIKDLPKKRKKQKGK